MGDDTDLATLLREIRDQQARQLDHQAQALALQREQFDLVRQQHERALQVTARAEQINERAASLQSNAGRALRFILFIAIPLVLLLLALMLWPVLARITT